MAVSRLDRCPKCKGRLLLEKDNYGLYQQCLQCGYLHDLKIFPIIEKQEIEEEKGPAAPYRVTVKHSQGISRNEPPLVESAASTALAAPLDLQLILDDLRKIQQAHAR